jgi:hypothetical protein
MSALRGPDIKLKLARSSAIPMPEEMDCRRRVLIASGRITQILSDGWILLWKCKSEILVCQVKEDKGLVASSTLA